MSRRDTRYIIVDTREKTPWRFDYQKKAALKHGDYTILGGKTSIVIERKSLTDLFVTCSGSRFPKFIKKMRTACLDLDYVFIFIEASLAEVYSGIRHSRLPTPIVLACIAELMSLGVQVIFTGGGKKGKEFAEFVLRTMG